MRELAIKKRFWYPVQPDKAADKERIKWLDSLPGFAPDLDKEDAWSKYLPLHPAKEEGAPPCVVLLGEMGVGKSTVLHSMEEELRAAGQKVESRSFLEFQDTDKFRQFIRDAASAQKTIYLDGLDEFYLPGGMEALRGVLREQAGSRAEWRLRLTCRSADWDGRLLPDLEKIWGPQDVRVFRLAPLREKDVLDAAQAQDPQTAPAFLQQVHEMDLEPFARLPLALRGLLSQWQDDRKLSANRWKLFEAACRDLCRDTRHPTAHSPGLPVDQKLRIASAIALTLLLAGKNAVLIDGSIHDEQHVPMEQLRWCATRVVPGISDQETDRHLSEVLADTALFRGDAVRRRFDHLGYQDFLAAYCLADSEVPEERWMELVAAPNAGVAPQLRGLAGWLSYQSASFMSAVAERDFATLLLTGVDVMTDDVRERIVSQLLQHPMKWQAVSRNYFSWAPYRLLNHPGLSEQLKGWLQNEEASDEALVEALSLVRENDLTGLSRLVVSLALDQRRRFRVRAEALRALAKVGNEADRRKIIPLIRGTDDDEYDDIKGYALRAVWPQRLISAEDLFQALTPPKKSSYYGAYSAFLSREVIPDLRDDDLSAGLTWVLRHGRPEIYGSWNDLVNHIMQRSWRLFLSRPELQHPFAEAVLLFLTAYQDPLGEEQAERDERLKDPDEPRRRQRLVELLVEEFGRPARDLAYLVFQGHLLAREDFPFLLRRAGEATEAAHAANYAEIAWRIWNEELMRQHYDFILALAGYGSTPGAAVHPEEVRKAFRLAIGPIELDSEEATNRRPAYHEELKFNRDMEERRKREEERQKPPGWKNKIIEEFLVKFDQGNEGYWVNIAGLTCADDNDEMDGWLGNALQTQKSWGEYPLEIRNRILLAAQKYLEKATPIVPDKPSTVYHFNSAGYAALMTFRIEGIELSELGTLIGKWAVAIVHQPVTYGAANESERLHEELLQTAFAVEQEKVLNEVERYLRWDRESHSSATLLYRFEKHHPDALCQRLLGLIHERGKFDKFEENILERLLEWGCSEAEQCVLKRWQAAVSEGDEGASVGLASTLLATPSALRLWHAIADWLLGSETSGRAVLLKVASRARGNGGHIVNLPADQRLRLLIFMEKVFAREEDRKHIPEGAHWVGDEEAARRLRDMLLHLFVERGEVDELRLLQENGIGADWIDREISRAEEVRARTLVLSLSVSEVRDLIQSSTEVGPYGLAGAELAVLGSKVNGDLNIRVIHNTYYGPIAAGARDTVINSFGRGGPQSIGQAVVGSSAGGNIVQQTCYSGGTSEMKLPATNNQEGATTSQEMNNVKAGRSVIQRTDVPEAKQRMESIQAGKDAIQENIPSESRAQKGLFWVGALLVLIGVVVGFFGDRADTTIELGSNRITTSHVGLCFIFLGVLLLLVTVVGAASGGGKPRK